MSTFPQAPLGLEVDLNLSGTWTPITGYCRQPITITRGRPDENSQCNPGTAPLTLNNADGRFSSRNPSGAYYGSIGRNTPVRISVPYAPGTFLRFADDPVSYASCPDAAGLDITGDIDIRLDMNLTSWVPSILASKWNASSSVNERSWCLLLNSEGTLTLVWSANGIAFNITQATSTLPVPVGGEVAVRATLAHSTGVVTFYTAPSISGSWTQLGAAVTAASGATSIFNSTAPVAVGYAAGVAYDCASNNFPETVTAYTGLRGQVLAFQVLSGIGGTTEASPSFSSQTAGTTSFTDAQSNTWTLAGTSEITGKDYRFHGELASLPVTWDPSGHDIWTAAGPSGVLRRIQQGTTPALSAMKRAVLAAAGVVQFWPCEDGTGATQIGSATGGPPLQFYDGSPVLANSSAFQCAATLPTLNKATLAASIPAYSSDNSTAVVRFLLNVASGDSLGTGTLTGLIASFAAGGSITEVVLYNNGGDFAMQGLQGSSPIFTLTSTVPVAGFTGMVSMELVNLGLVGGTLTYRLTLLPLGATSESQASGTVAASTPGQVQQVALGLTAGLSQSAAGMLFIQDTYSDLYDAFAGPLNAWAGETAGTRFARLCAENSLQARIMGWPGASEAMGPQSVDTLTDLLQECETADQGMIYEPRDVLGLGYICQGALCNQAADVTLNYAAGNVSVMGPPTDDDQYSRNDWTVTRGSAAVTGGIFQATLDDGSAMSVSPPPAGIGDYDDSVTANLNLDSQLPDAAWWRVHLGTYPGERYPLITVDLADTTIPSSGALYQAAAAADIGSYIAISNPPSGFLVPDTIRQLATGTVEVLADFERQVSWNGVPESPYETAVSDDLVYGRADTDGSTLASATSTATSLSVSTTTSGSPLWTTNTGSPWTFTVSGTPVALNYFIVTTAQAASISAGDWFTISAFSGAIFQVTNVGSPVGGFVNITFTPAAPSGVNNPDTVTQVTGDFPFDWIAAGERITVIKITGSSSPQTATVVRSVNGVVKAITAGTDVRLFFPPVLALT